MRYRAHPVKIDEDVAKEDCFSPEPPYVSIQDQQHPLAAGSSRSRLLKEQSVSAAGDAADEILGGWSNMKYGSVRDAHCFHVKMKRTFSMLILSHGNTLSARAAHAYFCVNIASERKCLCSCIFIFCSSAFTTYSSNFPVRGSGEPRQENIGDVKCDIAPQ